MNGPAQFVFDFTLVPDGGGSIEVAAVYARPFEFRPGFGVWLTRNWHVWREFSRMADQIRNRGHDHWSASAIVYYIRLQTALAERDCEWKINQNNARDLAKLYAILRDCAGFFEFRLRADTIRCRTGFQPPLVPAKGQANP